MSELPAQRASFRDLFDFPLDPFQVSQVLP